MRHRSKRGAGGGGGGLWGCFPPNFFSGAQCGYLALWFLWEVLKIET